MNKSNKDLWQVIDYEVQMYFETRSTYDSLKTVPKDVKAKVVDNALVESMVLHTRIMVDMLISKGHGSDDIKLRDLVPDWCESENGKHLIDKLESVYGRSDVEDSPCWIFNKMLAHPTTWRADSYNYYSALKQIEPHVLDILKAIAKVKSTSMLDYYLVLH